MTQIDNRTQAQQVTPAQRPPRLRFAPSPTGFLHIGAFRTAIFSWLAARHANGKFILRTEDTDTKRTVEGALIDSIEGLRWIGMDIDEGPIIGGPYGPYSQLQRKATYQYYANKLVETGHAYRCYCTPERLDQVRKQREAQKLPPRYDRHCRNLSAAERTAIEASNPPFTIRLAMPLEGETIVPDELRGKMVFKHSDLDDIVILKSNGLALYHLAAMADDHLMDITHVIRGEEWIPTSPYHVTIYKALGWQLPLLYHVPTVLGKDRKKLSKRHNALPWRDYQRAGYLPEAIFNFLALIGWSYDDKTEIFSREELIRVFTLDRVGLSSGIFDPEKLLWMNGLYIRQLPLDELTERTLPYLERPAAEGGLPDDVQRPLDPQFTKRVLRLEQERMKTLGDAASAVPFFFQNDLTYEKTMLIQKNMDAARTRDALKHAYDLLSDLDQCQHESMELPMRELAKTLELKVGQLFGAVRVAVSASNATPPLFEMMEVLGREVSLKRLQQAITLLS